MISNTLQFLLSNSDDLIIVVNERLQVQAMSASSKNLFGRDDQGFPLSDICAKGDCEAVGDIIAHEKERALASAETRALLRLPDGRSLPTMLCMHRLHGSDAEDRSFLILAKPILPRGSGRGRLPGPKIFASSMEPTISIAANGFEIIECNKAAEALFGLRREDIIGSEGTRFAPDKAQAKDKLRDLRSQIESAGILRSQCSIRGAWDSFVSCEVICVAQYDDEGAIAGILCIFRDLGEEKAMEENVRRIAIDLRSCLRELDSLTASFEDEGSSAGVCLHLEDFGLSPRQIEVARLVVAGETTRSISRRLGLSESTVKSHITSLFKKTGTKTRAQLIGFIHARHLSLD